MRSIFMKAQQFPPDEELKMNWALGKAAHRSKRRREGTAPTHLLLLLPADRLSKHGQAFLPRNFVVQSAHARLPAFSTS